MCSSYFLLCALRLPSACLQAYLQLCSHLNRKVGSSFTLIIDVSYASARNHSLNRFVPSFPFIPHVSQRELPKQQIICRKLVSMQVIKCTYIERRYGSICHQVTSTQPISCKKETEQKSISEHYNFWSITTNDIMISDHSIRDSVLYLNLTKHDMISCLIEEFSMI